MFWKNFIELCNKKGILPTNAVKEIGIAAGSITQWKNGRIPRDSTLIKIAQYFNVTTEYLIGKEKATVEVQTKAEEFGKMFPRLSEYAKLFPQLTEEEQAIINAQMEFMLSKRGKK